MQIRSFQSSDFPFLARAVDEEWGWELKGCSPSERDALAVFYSAAAVGSCNAVFSAVNDEGVPCAFLCAELFSQSIPPKKETDWSHVMAAARAVLEGSAAGREVLDFYGQIAAVNARLLRQVKEAGVSPQAELRFFITAQSSRGLGAGRALLNAFGCHLHEAGVSCCLLFTDSHCNWQYYEKNGWQRAAYERWDCAGQPIDAFAYVKTFS